jgi:hypothetical protein
MSARLLAIITPGEEATALASFGGLAAIARAAGADVRLASFRDLPATRVDRHDHVVADTDAEMARITSATTQALDEAARRYGDVRMESVVRFGKARREVAIETDVYAPQIVVLFDAGAGGLSRLRSWALQRRLARRRDLRLFVLETPRAVDGRRRHVPALRRPEPLPARHD